MLSYAHPCIPNSLTVLWTAVEMVDNTSRAPAIGKELPSPTASVLLAPGFLLPALEGRKLISLLPQKDPVSCRMEKIIKHQASARSRARIGVIFLPSFQS